MDTLEGHARRGNVVVFAGAGVSAGWPSALPGWTALNALIVDALCTRLESALQRPGAFRELRTRIDAQRSAARFPPEYQAQIIEEMCGERYFHALQALDIDVVNGAHDGIAALAKAGRLKAIVTTNFDRLVERALERRGVDYEIAIDDDGYARVREGGKLPVIKIHGCVSAHLSMIDTLKQRTRGRSRHLQDCLDPLHGAYWLYLGFSAADLDGNPSYLGLRAGAARSPGATYLSYPGNPTLGPGAEVLRKAYGDRGHFIVADTASHLRELCAATEAPQPDVIAAAEAVGPRLVAERLGAWADGLSVASAGLCLAAILEAIGEAEHGVHILDRLVRKEIYRERDTPDFRALELHYGRLGAAWGRFNAVPDLNGFESNASVESSQSLKRLANSDVGFAALSWLACASLWSNEGERATQIAEWLINGLIDKHWNAPEPRSDEDVVDGWLAAAQVFIFNANPAIIDATSQLAIERAKRSGDVVRQARVAALHLLNLTASTENIYPVADRYTALFEEAGRVGDGFALGIRELAFGRWYVGPAFNDRPEHRRTAAGRAFGHLEEAIGWLERQGMDPWVLFARLQQAKAYADLSDHESAARLVNGVIDQLGRFPLLASRALEAAAQLRWMTGDPTAAKTFEAAIDAAEDSGLMHERERLKQYLTLSDA